MDIRTCLVESGLGRTGVFSGLGCSGQWITRVGARCGSPGDWGLNSACPETSRHLSGGFGHVWPAGQCYTYQTVIGGLAAGYTIPDHSTSFDAILTGNMQIGILRQSFPAPFDSEQISLAFWMVESV